MEGRNDRTHQVCLIRECTQSERLKLDTRSCMNYMHIAAPGQRNRLGPVVLVSAGLIPRDLDRAS